MSKILKQEPGLIQYQAAAGDGKADNPFNVPFTIYDVTLLSVYLTPAGTVADDSLNILTYDVDYIAANYVTGFSGYVQLLSSLYPEGADDGDIITIFFDVGSAVVIPQYPLCAASVASVDSVIPVLGAGCTWIKSSDGTKILSQAVPSTQPVDLPTVHYAAVRYKDSDGSTQSSNMTLTPIRIGQSTYYDNVTGVNNLTINGTVHVTNSGSTPTVWTTIGESINVPMGSVNALSLSSLSSFSIAHQNNTSYDTTFLGANQSQVLQTSISYTLPPYQATIGVTKAKSLLANDGIGNLSWMTQSSISEVGTIKFGSWNAGTVTSSGNITASNFIARLGGNGTFPGTVKTTAIALGDSGSNTATIKSPENFDGSATYVWPQAVGKGGDILSIQSVVGNTATFGWLPLKQAWVRFNCIKDLDNNLVVAISQSYGVSTVNRIATGIFDIVFTSPFSLGWSYIWLGNGYSSVDDLGNQNGIFHILQLAPSFAEGKYPQKESCRMILYNYQQAAQDPFVETSDINVGPPEVCIMFIGN